MGSGESKEAKSPPSTDAAAVNERRRPPHARISSARGAPPLLSAGETSTASSAQLNAINVSRTRPRSITAASTASASQTPHRHHLSLHHDFPASHKSDSAMGQGESKHTRPPSRANTIHVQSPSPASQHAAASEHKAAAAASSSSPAVQAAEVPLADHDGVEDKESHLLGYSESPYGLPPANYIRPPRLPLPIEEEIHTPGSPIISPQDVQNSTTVLDPVDVEGGALPRKTSVLSSTTVDDDDIGDNEVFAPEASQWGEIRVPTKLEWNGVGDKIFVTGTFCNWEKKVKLHKNKDKSGFSATVNLRPGTHHVKFLVDGEMVTSNDLPTTVDWTNILVNYIEIAAPMPQTSEEEEGKQTPVPAVPMPIPGASMTADPASGTNELATRTLTDGAEARVPETEADAPSTLEQAAPKDERNDTGLEKQPTPSTATPAPKSSQAKPEPKPTPAPPKKKLPRPKYTNQIPDFLMDLDNFNNPDDERFQRAQRVATTLPAPPSLPMFLSKSILNGATPHKDDASVLIMPNHTVLNHLATSSIKSGVLATSGTTRYKRKFLTTIMYKPTSDDG